MALEIERKFLVCDTTFEALAYDRMELAQGYLSTDPDATVRVRICGDKAWMTVKSRNVGAVRNEWEYPIPIEDARRMLEACCGRRRLEKTRYLVDAGDGLKWEVDVFHGRHSGLTVAEIELPDPQTPFALPSFIGREVTGDPQYYNSALCSD